MVHNVLIQLVLDIYLHIVFLLVGVRQLFVGFGTTLLLVLLFLLFIFFGVTKGALKDVIFVNLVVSRFLGGLCLGFEISFLGAYHRTSFQLGLELLLEDFSSFYRIGVVGEIFLADLENISDVMHKHLLFDHFFARPIFLRLEPLKYHVKVEESEAVVLLHNLFVVFGSLSWCLQEERFFSP